MEMIEAELEALSSFKPVKYEDGDTYRPFAILKCGEIIDVVYDEKEAIAMAKKLEEDHLIVMDARSREVIYPSDVEYIPEEDDLSEEPYKESLWKRFTSYIKHFIHRSRK